MSQASDMRAARARTTVDVDAVKHLLWNGQPEWERHARLVRILAHDPVFDKSRKPHEARPAQFRRGLAATKRLLELQDRHGWSDDDLRAAFAVSGEASPVGLHYVAFLPVIMAQGSPEQVATYGARGAAHAILGCYAQTELAHGTQVANLETTATYLPATREFELHSPRLESAKWWIGALGKFATHAVVQARLVLPDGDKGPHLFVLQLRSLDDHRVLPGITLGDIGPKAFGAYGAVDNGWMRLDRVRIPAADMLSKFARVTPEGRYVVPVHAKLSYGGMIYIRAGMVTTGGWLLAKAATIAIRYTTVRRQGGGPPGAETPVLAYPAVHHRLLPVLARAYAFIFLGRDMLALYRAMAAQLAQQSTALLAETHAVASGLKILVAAGAADDLETARRALGGHGYAAAAGIGALWANWVPANTYEGDNYVLAGQVVRAALKAHRLLAAAPDPHAAAQALASMRFLRLLHAPAPAPRAEAAWSTQDAVRLLELRGAHMVHAHARAGDAEVDGGAEMRVARAVTDAFVAPLVAQASAHAAETLRGAAARVVPQVLQLYLLTTLDTALADLLALGLVPAGGAGAHSLRAATAALERVLLPEAIGLTDAFGLSDFELDSALGVEDGRAYEALWERAKGEPLNEGEVVPEYEEFIKPILERGRRIVEARGRAKL